MRGKRIYDHDPLISRGSYYVKGCFGTVPVEADGSAYFKAPSGVELYFQALDKDGKELSRMGSVTQVMPGEHQSCVGCHEPRSATAPNVRKMAVNRRPLPIKPPPWGKPGPIDFVKHVQPVFDKYCVKCHGGPTPDGQLDLSGDKTRYFNMAYEHLLAKNLVHFIYINRGLTGNFLPKQTGSHVSRLTAYLDDCQGRSKKKMSDVDRRTVFTWIDANCPYYSTYDNTRPGTPGSRDAWAGTGLPGSLRKWSLQARETDINLTNPAHSRALQSALAQSAGGLAEDGQARFKSKADPDYRAALAEIEKAKTALDKNPRVDMPGAKPVPYPVDFGGLYTGFAGP